LFPSVSVARFSLKLSSLSCKDRIRSCFPFPPRYGSSPRSVLGGYAPHTGDGHAELLLIPFIPMRFSPGVPSNRSPFFGSFYCDFLRNYQFVPRFLSRVLLDDCGIHLRNNEGLRAPVLLVSSKTPHNLTLISGLKSYLERLPESPLMLK